MITAVDVGATKTLVAQFKKGVMQPLNELRFATPHNPQEFMDELAHHLGTYTELGSITIAVPGIVDDAGIVLRCGRLPWKNVPLKTYLEQTYHVPVGIENDAKLAALAEVNSLPSIPKMGLYITVSTGIGTGIVTHGKLDPALRNSEAGHMHLDFRGKRQTWQDFASGYAIVSHFGKRAEEITAIKDWQEITERLKIGLGALLPAIQPDVVIFGGGVGGSFNKFGHMLTESLREELEPYIKVPDLRQAQHPQEAVIYGCYYYATHKHA